MKKLIAALLMAFALAAHGQKYTVISASSGGDLGDLIRHTALARVPHVHEPSPGGDGLIAPSKFAAKPAGKYLLLSGLMTQQVVGPRLHPERANYSDADLVPITLLAMTHFVVVAHPQAAFPHGRIAVAGSNAQFVVRLIGKQIGMPLEPVAYKGIAHGILDAARGDVEFALVQVGTAQPHLAAGRVRLVGEFPEIPAAFGLYGQRGMSAHEVVQLVRAIATALQMPSAKQTYAEQYLRMPESLGPKPLIQLIETQRKSYGDLK